MPPLLQSCNNLIFYLLPPHILVHPYISFYSIPMLSISQLTLTLIFQFIFQFLFIYIYMCIIILVLFVLSVCCCCLCALEACDSRTNSLYAEAYLAIKLFLTSDYYVCMSYLSFWNKLYLWKYVLNVLFFQFYKKEYKELFCDEVK